MGMTEKPLEYYPTLPYTLEIERSGEEYFVTIVELPGCMTWAGTLEEIEPRIKDAMICWIRGSLEYGASIPEQEQ
jgi:predicted RNase H-like HicB family nuclease